MISKIGYNIKKPKFNRKIRSVVNLLLPLYKNWCITKKFPIETIRKRTDSSIRNLEKAEYDKQNWLQHHKIQVRPLVVNHGKVRKIHWSHRVMCGGNRIIGDRPHFEFLAKLGFFDVVANFAYHIRLLQGLVH